MKYLILALLSSHCMVAQITDDFDDGDFTQNQKWYGDTQNFEVDSINQLHLIAPAVTANSYLCFESNLLENTTWEISLKMDFNPSSSNYLDWYILANDSILNQSNEAYFIRVGGTGDQLILYKKEGEQSTILIESSDAIVNTNPVAIRLKVARNIGGEFKLWADLLNDGNWILIGSVTDLTELKAQYSGVNCKYPSTRSDKFYFDNFSINGAPFIDSIPPKLMTVELIDSSSILLEFSKNETLELTNQQFEILPYSINATSLIQSESLVQVHFDNNFPVNEEFQLKITSISDSIGNHMNDTLIDFYVQEHQQFDLIINELMVDPEPHVQLENVEYIELYNRATYNINLLDWIVVIDEKEYKLDTLQLIANDYLILHNENDSIFFDGYNSSTIPFSSLNNTEGYIGLFDSENNLIHEVNYSKDWYENSNKENGGWALEMIDFENYCTGKGNWKACKNSMGGSPGLPNSVLEENLDTSKPFLVDIVILKEDEIQLNWSENLYDSTLYFFNSYGFSNGLTPQGIHHFMDETTIQFFDEISPNTNYQINIGELKDCQGNKNSITGEFVLGIWAEEDQIIINEILFNPKTDGYDYVELYNNSEYNLDLAKLLIGNYDPLLESIENTEIISESIYSIPPKSYVVLCEDTTWLSANYFREHQSDYIEIHQMPSFPNSEGTVAISDIAYQLIDEIRYSEEQHFPLLEEVDGVALERLNPESTQWFSGASTDNYGTPGRKNSQFVYQKKSKSILSVDPEIFSPNNDGKKDFTSIVLQIEEAAKTSISIYNRRGTQVKSICKNELVNSKASWVWNGLNEDSFRLPIGIYILVAEIIEGDGKLEVLKEPIVISGY